MKLYTYMIHLYAKMEIGGFNASEKIAQKYSNGDFSNLMYAVKYAEKHEPDFNPFPMLDAVFAEYRPPFDAEERLLKAEIAGDEKWTNFWRKYVTA